MKIISPPPSIIKKINSIIFRFLWADQPETIKRETLMLPIDQGGLQVYSIQNRIKNNHIQLIQKYVSANTLDHAWMGLFKYWLGIPLRVIKPIQTSDVTTLFESPILTPFRITYRQHPNIITYNNKTSSKIINSKLSELSTHTPKIKLLYPSINLKELSKYQYYKILTSREKDLLYLMVNHGLYTKTLQQNRSSYTISTNCNYCNRYPETQEHLYHLCNFLHPARKFFITHVQNITNDKSFTLPSPYFNVSKYPEKQIKYIALFYIEIWNNRSSALTINDFIYKLYNKLN